MAFALFALVDFVSWVTLFEMVKPGRRVCVEEGERTPGSRYIPTAFLFSFGNTVTSLGACSQFSCVNWFMSERCEEEKRQPVKESGCTHRQTDGLRENGRVKL